MSCDLTVDCDRYSVGALTTVCVHEHLKTWDACLECAEEALGWLSAYHQIRAADPTVGPGGIGWYCDRCYPTSLGDASHACLLTVVKRTGILADLALPVPAGVT